MYHMHGNTGKGSKGVFFDTMLLLAKLGFSSLSCDGRGYSPHAAPDHYHSYHYDKLASDVFSLINASGLSAPYDNKFHIAAHDQGARVAWHAIALGPIRNHLLSFTSLSIPHSDVFSDALYGPHVDADQQAASQYVRELVMPNSTTVYDDAIFKVICKGEGWMTPASCQRTLFWYNGAIDSGAMALAPMNSWGTISKMIGIPENTVRKLTQYPLHGVPQTVKVGNVSEFPVLYACGDEDPSDLCKQVFGDESGKLIEKYTYLKMAGCGHEVLGCKDYKQLQKLRDAIIMNIQSVYL